MFGFQEFENLCNLKIGAFENDMEEQYDENPIKNFEKDV